MNLRACDPISLHFWPLLNQAGNINQQILRSENSIISLKTDPYQETDTQRATIKYSLFMHYFGACIFDSFVL